MQSSRVPGTEGYFEEAEWLIPRYESIAFLDKYRIVAHLLPGSPGRILDIGAGTGVDSAWLAKAGHNVVAVEPVVAFREAGMQMHASCGIAWVDDSVPMLSKIMSRQDTFDVVLVTAVWMHLAPQERIEAMANITTLLKPGAILIMSLRHGPPPKNRRIFDVSASETIDLAVLNKLKVVLSEMTQSVQLINRQMEVSWSWLAFEK